MANKMFPTVAFSILNGPSTWDLALAIFDRKEQESDRRITFRVRSQEGDDLMEHIASVKITSLEKTADPCGWKFCGKLDRKFGFPSEYWDNCIHGEYNTASRKGKLEVQVVASFKEYEEYHAHGMDITKKLDRIISIKKGDREVKIGQRVVSNGRYPEFAKEGVSGIVTKLDEPHTDGRTTDVINVWFEGNAYPHYMKFRDLQF
jgi:hypothetical protein